MICVDGSLMKEYALNEPLTEGFLKFLEQFGTIRVFEQLWKPYFLLFKKSSSFPSRGCWLIIMSKCGTTRVPGSGRGLFSSSAVLLRSG